MHYLVLSIQTFVFEQGFVGLKELGDGVLYNFVSGSFFFRFTFTTFIKLYI